MLKVVNLPNKPRICRLVTTENHIHATSTTLPEEQNMQFCLGTQTVVAICAFKVSIPAAAIFKSAALENPSKQNNTQ